MPNDQRKMEVLFRATEGGYVFRAPNAWVVNPARHYFVTEAQKAQIVNILHISPWAVGALWLAMISVSVGGGALLLYLLTGHEDPTAADTAIMMVLAIAGALAPLPLLGYWQLHRLKPVLPTLQPTNERISFREVAEATRRATSARDYARNCMLSGINFGIIMLNVGMQLMIGLSKGRYISLTVWSVAAVLFGFALVRNGRLAMGQAQGSAACAKPGSQGGRK